MPGLSRVLLLAATLLAGCAGVPRQHQEPPAQAAITASFTEMHYPPLPLSEWQSITLDATQPAFAFPSGRSFYAARSLARSPLPRTLRFKAFVSAPPQASVLLPRFLFLNEAKQAVRLVLRYELRRDTDAARGVFFAGEVPVPAAARYFMLYATDMQLPELRALAADGRERVVPHAMTGTVDVNVAASGAG